MQCPCQSGRLFAECCEPLINGKPAANPEALMRSRYSAFVLKNMDYIIATTDPQRRYDFDHGETSAWMNESTFHRLEVMNSTSEGNKGTVEFKAHYTTKNGAEEIHHEVSKFRKQAGVWYFREGRSHKHT